MLAAAPKEIAKTKVLPVSVAVDFLVDLAQLTGAARHMSQINNEEAMGPCLM